MLVLSRGRRRRKYKNLLVGAFAPQSLDLASILFSGHAKYFKMVFGFSTWGAKHEKNSARKADKFARCVLGKEAYHDFYVFMWHADCTASRVTQCHNFS